MLSLLVLRFVNQTGAFSANRMQELMRTSGGHKAENIFLSLKKYKRQSFEVYS